MRNVPPVGGTCGSKCISLPNCDESRRIVVECFNYCLEASHVDILQRPLVLLGDTRAVAAIVEGSLILPELIELFQAVVPKREDEVPCLDVPAPPLGGRFSNISVRESSLYCLTHHLLPNVAQVLSNT